MGEQKVVPGPQSSEMKLHPVKEAPEVGKNTQLIDVPLDDADLFSVAVAPDTFFQLGSSTITGADTEVVSVIPSDGITAETSVANDTGQFKNGVEESSGEMGKGKEKLIGPVISLQSPCSKSPEELKAPEPGETGKEWDVCIEKEKRGRKRNPTSKNSLNEFQRTRTHLRYLLHRIKYEQSLIDAYSAEGWKGQSLEKLKPEKELQRAKSHIMRYKLKIRALLEQLDRSLSIGKLSESLFDSKGEIHSEDIFCAKCGSKDLTPDNDIILCDGTCTRGFHQYCLEPPLLKEDIPPGDECWMCPGCACKLDCIDMLKDFHSTKVSLTDSWEKIFPEAARASSGNNLDVAARSSDDSEDDDYDPGKPETSQKDGEDQTSPNESGYFSAPEDLVPLPVNEINQGLPSEDSEDDDFEPSVVDEGVNSESSDFTSDADDIVEDSTRNLPPNGKELLPGPEGEPKEELSYLMESVSGKRNRERLDYKKLHDEAYGNSSPDSSDEDFEDTTANKKNRTYHLRTELPSPSPDGMDERHGKMSSLLPKNSERANANDPGSGEQSSQFGSTGKSSRRTPYKRLGEAATQKLYSSFVVNKYPDRSAKEKLANELGISMQQVSKWFENARWSVNHRPDATSNPSSQAAGQQEAGSIPSTNSIPEEKVDDSMGNASESTTTRKRKGN